LPQSTIIVRWPWVLLLGLYVVLAIILLLTTMSMTYAAGIQPYKRSALAASTALGPDLRNSLGTLDDITKLRRVADATDVTLVTGIAGEGVAFVRSRR